jgi:hypothetical protein
VTRRGVRFPRSRKVMLGGVVTILRERLPFSCWASLHHPGKEATAQLPQQAPGTFDYGVNPQHEVHGLATA